MNISPKLLYIIAFALLTTFGFTQTERWVYRYNGSGNGGDCAYCICYGGDGNIYAVGDCTGGDSVLHFTIISLAPDGTERWVYQYPSLSYGKEICFGGDGNICAVGNTTGRILVVSVDGNGNERWHYVYSTPSSEPDPGRSIVYGLDGNIYVTGYTGPVYNRDITVISLNPSGAERWVYLYNGPGNTYDYGCDVIYASDDNLYIIGETDSTYNSYIFGRGLMFSLTASGDERWTYISPNANPGGFCCGDYGADGNLYYEDYFSIMSFTNSGSPRWAYQKHGWGNYNDITHSLVYGVDGNIYAGGTIGDSITG